MKIVHIAMTVPPAAHYASLFMKEVVVQASPNIRLAIRRQNQNIKHAETIVAKAAMEMGRHKANHMILQFQSKK